MGQYNHQPFGYSDWKPRHHLWLLSLPISLKSPSPLNSAPTVTLELAYQLHLHGGHYSDSENPHLWPDLHNPFLLGHPIPSSAPLSFPSSTFCDMPIWVCHLPALNPSWAAVRIKSIFLHLVYKAWPDLVLTPTPALSLSLCSPYTVPHPLCWQLCCSSHGILLSSLTRTVPFALEPSSWPPPLVSSHLHRDDPYSSDFRSGLSCCFSWEAFLELLLCVPRVGGFLP